jgi:hypothetical protein
MKVRIAPDIGSRDFACAFLFFGYFPWSGPESRLNRWAPLLRDPGFQERRTELNSLKHRALVHAGVEALEGAFDDTVAGDHVVGLSGGLDSRIILSQLVKRGLGPNTLAVTFGTPGTLDYEIGASVADAVGVRHEAIDLTQVEITQAGLEEAVSSRGFPTSVWDTFLNRLTPKRFGHDRTYWSGFMGDSIAGAHLPHVSSETWSEACSTFTERSRFSKTIDLIPQDYHVGRVLPNEPFFAQSEINYDDQLDFVIRQDIYTTHVSCSVGYQFVTPLIHASWLRFALGVDTDKRRGLKLYEDILMDSDPFLFSLPCKNRGGATLNSSSWSRLLLRARSKVVRGLTKQYRRGRPPTNQFTNYIDFDEGFRTRTDLRSLADTNLDDLSRRGLVDWLDLQQIWEEHLSGERDHWRALLALISLEINLKVLSDGS